MDDNLLTIQFNCLADWNKTIEEGTWLFREQAFIIEEYDGFPNPKWVKLDRIVVCAQIHELPYYYLKEPTIRVMVSDMGEIKEVQIKLPSGLVGSFVRVRVKLDVHKS